MAYASIATVPLGAAIACALLPALAYAALGSSRAVSVSTTSSIAILTAAVIADQAAGSCLETAGGLAVLAGLMLLAAGLLRLGFLADFVSVPADHPVRVRCNRSRVGMLRVLDEEVRRSPSRSTA